MARHISFYNELDVVHVLVPSASPNYLDFNLLIYSLWRGNLSYCKTVSPGHNWLEHGWQPDLVETIHWVDPETDYPIGGPSKIEDIQISF